MIVTTTNIVEGYRIAAYHGIVVGSSLLQADAFRDFSAGVRDSAGEPLAAYEESFQQVREMARSGLEAWVKRTGGNAVVDLEVECNEFGSSIVIASASGMSVTIERV
jgi:uncharacterized protein YbjQ (UPF0145 family)